MVGGIDWERSFKRFGGFLGGGKNNGLKLLWGVGSLRICFWVWWGIGE